MDGWAECECICVSWASKESHQRISVIIRWMRWYILCMSVSLLLHPTLFLPNRQHEQRDHGVRVRVRWGLAGSILLDKADLAITAKCSSCQQQSVRLSVHFLEVSLSHQILLHWATSIMDEAVFFFFFFPPWIDTYSGNEFPPLMACFYQNYRIWT